MMKKNQMDNLIEIPKKYLEKILKPIARITESCVLKSKESLLYCVCSSEDNSVILYAKMRIPDFISDGLRLNLISAKRFITGLNCLDDDGKFELKISNNNIVCQSTTINGEKSHFKYHLVDDSIITECPIKIEKIAELTFDTTFTISLDKIRKILGASSFANDANKVYMSCDGTYINVEIDDKTVPNIDSMTIQLTDEWEGLELEGCFATTMEIFKNLILSKSDVKVKINNRHKVAIFDMEDDDAVSLTYIVTALVK